MQKIILSMLIAVLLAAPFRSSAAVTLPTVIGSNMVLQREKPVPIWGWAAPGEQVTVRFAGQRKTVKADTTGRWEIRLAAMKASATPADLTIEAGGSLTLTNILVGEVWFCSGQSNMEKPLGEHRGQQPTFNFEQELAAGDHFPLVRIYRQMDHIATNTPMLTADGSWAVCSSNSLKQLDFSAAAYFFGRDIQHELGVPVGLVESAWGGTRIEPWTPREGFAAVPALADFAKINLPPGRINATNAIALYNGMIAPIVPFAIRGALWYQGESNVIGTHDGLSYLDKMRALIGGWRKVWGEGDFPFYYVQIAPYRYYSDPNNRRTPSPEDLPEVWQAQTFALDIKNTGMIVTTDITDDVNDIHPRNKLDVGKRLALVALAKTYGRKDVVFSGPLFKQMKVQNDKAVLSFDYVEGGLKSRDGKPLDWFTIAGADKAFKPATAVIEGKQIIVSSPDVSKPVAVRFAWNELATPNLENGAALPAISFRTDAPKH